MTPLRLQPSTVIREARYVPLAANHKSQAPGHGWVLVTFHGGRTWAYLAPYWTAGLLAAAKSPGRVYNRILKGRSAVIVAEAGVEDLTEALNRLAVESVPPRESE